MTIKTPDIYQYSAADQVVSRYKTAEEFLEAHLQVPAEKLALLVVNTELNDFVRRLPDDVIGGLYFGWWWRSVDWFSERGITVARRSPGITRVCQNNKWGYPQRYLTVEEQAEFRRLVWKAYRAGQRGGCLADIEDLRARRMAKAAKFLNALEVPDSEQ